MTGTFEPALIIIGLVLCLFGWTLYWAGLRLMGGVCGAIAGAALGAVVVLLGGWDTYLNVGCAIAAVLGGVIGLWLIVRAHYVLFFFTGAVAGLTTAWVFESAWLPWVQTRIPATLGQILYYSGFTLVGGLLILFAHRMIVTTLTAFAGTVVFVLGLPNRYQVWLFLPVFITSLVVQLGILRALGEKGGVPAKQGEGQPQSQG